MHSKFFAVSLFVSMVSFLSLGCSTSRPVDNCANLDCDDGVECTVDSCSADTGWCEHEVDDSLCPGGHKCDATDGCVALPCESDTDCDDGLFCNGKETCDNGTCAAGAPMLCDDGIACTMDSCDEENDKCEFSPDDSLCSDGQTCDTELGCTGGQACTEDADCDDNIDCTVDSCDVDSGMCMSTADDSLCEDGQVCNPALGCVSDQTCSEDADCDDGEYCNGKETCQDGVCVSGSVVDCDDHVDCTVDTCDEDTDGCTNTVDHSLCEDGQLCDPEQGCVAVPCSSDGDCDDGLFCNGQETCDNGTCTAGAPMLCDDGIACTMDRCDEDSDSCVYETDDSFCDDGAWCNGAETCDATNGCQDGVAPNCDDGVDCTIDICDEDADECMHVTDDSVCDDGAWCNGDETCDATNGCQDGVAPNCDDGVDCTEDICDEDADACMHTTDDSVCDDGAWCNGAETCDDVNGCQAGTSPDCNDGVDCTVDSCDEDNDVCVSIPSDMLCDDTNACTDDRCSPGISPDATGCTHTNLENGASCSDDNVCNGNETCRDGMCQAGAPLFCSDDNPCTVNYCAPAAGCMVEPAPEGTSCSDGNRCNGDEVCDANGACQEGVPLDCDDSNPCTADFCVPAEGCQNVNNIDVCDDGDDCTSNDRCVDGVCVGVGVEICGDGLDNDCNGTVDDGCGGIGTFVAPWGDDSNPGTMDEPLETISAGISNALLIGPPQVVYVAGDDSYQYNEDVIMQPGVSVYGGYSTDGNWDYDPVLNSTILEPVDPRGVMFVNPGIDVDTVLDGVTIVGVDGFGQGSETTALSIDGCSPTINNCRFFNGDATTCHAISISGAAAPVIASTDIMGSSCRVLEMIRVEDSSMGLFGTHIQVADAGRKAVGIELVEVGNVEIRYNQIEGGDVAQGSLSAGIHSTGGFSQLAIGTNYVAAGEVNGNNAVSAAILLTGCNGGLATIVDNAYLAGNNATDFFGGDGHSYGVAVTGQCDAEISSNGYIVGSGSSADSAVGVVCDDDSMCNITGNSLIAGIIPSDETASTRAAGISCNDSCNSIVGNQVIYGGRSNELYGITLSGLSAPLVDSNNVYAGECSQGNFISTGGIGVYMESAGARLVNNIIFGGFCSASIGMHVNYVPLDQGSVEASIINSNYINASGRDNGWGSQSVGISLSSESDNVAPMDEFRNNIVDAGYASNRVGVLEQDSMSDPRSFDYNDLVGATDALYVDENSDWLVSIDQVNALSDMETGSNMSVYPDLVNPIPFGDFHLNDSSPLIDAGTDLDAPDHDYEGDARPSGQGYDVGADER